eukprot:CAMPEP_0177667606 /NCGR_PEP_ID=MMETSP0447-20121125/22219_1 /TAXON_ID=0 /ORGANISM="Stygamoeba regulata, Strain BSH-02190019" /LENGTH=804 /DNA_ID=CAMNT_0019173861 /DNA_START=2181 /DNA_END=4595 /DNA_ORIENTATION=-
MAATSAADRVYVNPSDPFGVLREILVDEHYAVARAILATCRGQNDLLIASLVSRLANQKASSSVGVHTPNAALSCFHTLMRERAASDTTMLLRAQTAETRLLQQYLRLSADRYLHELLYDVTNSAFKAGLVVKFEHSGNGASSVSNPQVLESLAQTYIDRVLEFSSRLPESVCLLSCIVTRSLYESTGIGLEASPRSATTNSPVVVPRRVRVNSVAETQDPTRDTIVQPIDDTSAQPSDSLTANSSDQDPILENALSQSSNEEGASHEDDAASGQSDSASHTDGAEQPVNSAESNTPASLEEGQESDVTTVMVKSDDGPEKQTKQHSATNEDADHSEQLQRASQVNSEPCSDPLPVNGSQCEGTAEQEQSQTKKRRGKHHTCADAETALDACDLDPFSSSSSSSEPDSPSESETEAGKVSSDDAQVAAAQADHEVEQAAIDEEAHGVRDAHAKHDMEQAAATQNQDGETILNGSTPKETDTAHESEGSSPASPRRAASAEQKEPNDQDGTASDTAGEALAALSSSVTELATHRSRSSTTSSVPNLETEITPLPVERQAISSVVFLRYICAGITTISFDSKLGAKVRANPEFQHTLVRVAKVLQALANGHHFSDSMVLFNDLLRRNELRFCKYCNSILMRGMVPGVASEKLPPASGSSRADYQNVSDLLGACGEKVIARLQTMKVSEELIERVRTFLADRQARDEIIKPLLGFHRSSSAGQVQKLQRERSSTFRRRSSFTDLKTMMRPRSRTSHTRSLSPDGSSRLAEPASTDSSASSSSHARTSSGKSRRSFFSKLSSRSKRTP